MKILDSKFRRNEMLIHRYIVHKGGDWQVIDIKTSLPSWGFWGSVVILGDLGNGPFASVINPKIPINPSSIPSPS